MTSDQKKAARLPSGPHSGVARLLGRTAISPTWETARRLGCMPCNSATQSASVLVAEAALAPIGLRLHPDRTRIVNLTRGAPGFDFLGFHNSHVPVREVARSLLPFEAAVRSRHGVHPSQGQRTDGPAIRRTVAQDRRGRSARPVPVLGCVTMSHYRNVLDTPQLLMSKLLAS
jgi:hypothetical protein